MKVTLFGILVFLTGNAFSNVSVDYVKTNAIKVHNLKLPSEAIEHFSKNQISLIGDYHGTNEIPQIVYSIVEQLALKSKVRVGLEFPVDIQSKVAEFMKTGDKSVLRKTRFFQDSTYHSGKGSLAMIGLLEKLRGLDNVEVFCFDLPDGDQTDSSEVATKLANNVLSSYRKNPPTKTIVYTGNIHSRLTKGVPWDANYVTMGSEIFRLAKKENSSFSISSVLIRLGSGSAFVCLMEQEKINCGPHKLKDSQSHYFSSLPFDYFLKESKMTDGHDFSLILHKTTASLSF